MKCSATLGWTSPASTRSEPDAPLNTNRKDCTVYISRREFLGLLYWIVSKGWREKQELALVI
eukprot:1159942-Pelagomonas_calceolata.AAC.11